MSDEGMDPCECLWGHELAMRRLLSLLRNSQAYCTDSACFEEVGGVPNQNQDTNNLLLMSLVFAFALFMYYIRPKPQSVMDKPEKSGHSGNDSNGAPPTPPPAMS